MKYHCRMCCMDFDNFLGGRQCPCCLSFAVEEKR